MSSTLSEPVSDRIVLVAVDFDNPSRYAMRAACEIAGRVRAGVVVAHVCRDRFLVHTGGAGEPPPRKPHAASATDTAQQKLEAFVQSADIDASLRGRVVPVLKQGDPAARILELVRELHPLLVVVGTQGRRGLARLVLGSVAERVVRNSPAPVLSIGAPPLSASAA